MSAQVQIDAPELLTGSERRRDTVLTAIMWFVYLYLWVPLISLFAWLLGFEFAYDVMVRSGGARNLGGILITYGVSVIVIFLAVSVWSLGNKMKYGHLRRRLPQPDTAPQDMADYFDVDVAMVEMLRESRSVSIEFDDTGRPLVAPREGQSPASRRQYFASEAANVAASDNISQK